MTTTHALLVGYALLAPMALGLLALLLSYVRPARRAWNDFPATSYTPDPLGD